MISRVAMVELIPRAVLFGNPERTSPHISPDGKYVAFSYLGDIWIVETIGGVAIWLTTVPSTPR